MSDVALDRQEGQVLTITEAAQFLHVHRITLYRLLKARKLPGAFKMGRVWRINREGLERFTIAGNTKEKGETG